MYACASGTSTLITRRVRNCTGSPGSPPGLMSVIASLSCCVLAQLPRICNNLAITVSCLCVLKLCIFHQTLDSNVLLSCLESMMSWTLDVFGISWDTGGKMTSRINANHESETMPAFFPRRLTQAHPPGVLACSPVGQGRSRVALAT